MKLPCFPKAIGQNVPEEDFNPLPDLTPTPPPKKYKIEYIIFAASLLIFLSSLGFYLFFRNNQSKLDISSDSIQQALAVPTPTPKPLPKGSQEYLISHGPLVVGPKLSKVIIDPIDPTPDQTITITADISYDSEITQVIAYLITDNQSQPLELELISGSKTDGTWQIEIKTKDTYLYTYRLNFELKSSVDNYTGGLTFRQ